MDRVKIYLILFALIFVTVFLVDYLIIKSKSKIKKKNQKKNNESMELNYLLLKFKLDKNKLPLNKILLFISLFNAFIIALVASLVLLIDVHPIIQLLIGFVMLIGLIYAIYELFGRYLIKKGYGKDGK